MSAAEPRSRFELGWAAACFAVLSAWFLWTPISRLGTETLSPVDALQRSGWSAIDPSWRPGNVAQTSVATDLHASYALEHQDRARGISPAWDRFTGYGSPPAARPALNTLSPSAWIHRLLPLDRALLVEAFAKLFLAGFLAYGFLRALRLSTIACAFGAVSFMFSGTLLEHLARPASAVAVALVGGLWVVESLARRVERDAPSEPVALSRLVHPKHAALFAATVALGAAAGDLQAFAWMAVMLAGFACARAIALARRDEHTRSGGIALASIVAQYTLLGGLAAAVSGSFVVSSFEFALESWSVRESMLSSIQAPASSSAGTAFFPALLGDPAHGIPGGVATFTGLLTVFCALLSPAVVRGRKALVFFGAAALAHAAFLYDVCGLRGLLHTIPAGRLVTAQSGLLVFHLATAVCAAFFVHRASTRGPKRDVTAALVILCAALVCVFVARAGASSVLLSSVSESNSDAARSALAEHAPRHMFVTSAWFFLGAALAACSWIFLSPRARLLPLAGCIAVVLATNAVPFKGFHSTSPNTFVFAPTAAFEELRSRIGDHRPLFMGPGAPAPRIAAMNGVESWSDASGAELARVERLRRHWFVRDADGHGARWASMRGLRAFGIERIVSEGSRLDVDTWTGFEPPNERAEYLTRPLLADANVEFDFVLLDPGASSLRVCFETGGGPLLQNIELNVHDRASGERLSQRLLSPDFAHPNHEKRVFVDVPLPRLADWSTRRLRLVVGSNDSDPKTAWSLVARRDWKRVMNAGLWRAQGVLQPPIGVHHPSLHQFAARQDGRELRGAIVVDMTWRDGAFREERPLAGRHLFEFTDTSPRFRTASRALAARGAEDAFLMTTAATFDPAHAVVIEGIESDSGPQSGGDDEPVEVVSRGDDAIRLRAVRGRPGWLVTSEPWYPGWRARVNGVVRPIHRANYAFGAVALDAGASEIVLEYVPSGARIGTWAAWLACASLLVWFSLSGGSRLSRAARSA